MTILHQKFSEIVRFFLVTILVLSFQGCTDESGIAKYYEEYENTHESYSLNADTSLLAFVELNSADFNFTEVREQGATEVICGP